MTNKREPVRAKQVGGTISKSIGEYYTEYINALVASGRYCTVAEVLREALRLHEENKLTNLTGPRSVTDNATDF